MAHRYFSTDIDPARGRARLTGADAAHLARVLRVRPGAQLTLCDGAGSDYLAEVVAANAGEVTLAILSAQPSVSEPALRVQLYIGLAKGERMDYAIQKSVELGAGSITPFYSQNTVVKPKNMADKLARYNRIAAEAAKQSGRGMLPPVHPALDFAAVLRQAAACQGALLLYEHGGASLRDALAAFPALNNNGAQLAVITGPEGGFTPTEAGQAEQSGCRPVHLGPRILRCETAPVAALAAIMALSGHLE